MRWRWLFSCALLGCSAADATTPQTRDAAATSCTASPTFTPIAWREPRAAEDACTDKEIDESTSACLGGTIPIRCEQFSSEHTKCASCIYPKAGGAGAIIEGQGRAIANVGGCIAVSLGEVDSSGCGAREHAMRECVASVCTGCDHPQCEAEAREGPCASLQRQRCPELAGAAPCALDEGTEKDVRRIAKRMCGMPPEVPETGP